ncbi:TPA: hypothetical protein ACYLN4_000572 [Burkholderia lata]
MPEQTSEPSGPKAAASQPSLNSQTVVRVMVSAGTRTSSQWRGTLSAIDAPWDEIAVYQGGTALSIIARTPSASSWLAENTSTVALPIIDLLNEVIRIDVLNRQVAMRSTPYLWQYVFPKIIVAKDKKRWDEASTETLGVAVLQRITTRIANDLTRHAVAWGLIPAEQSIRVTLTDHGKPMPITHAVRGDANQAGKPVTALARLNVRVAIDARIEGEWQAGMLTGLGYGRLFREGYAKSSDLSPSNLAELGIELENH